VIACLPVLGRAQDDPELAVGNIVRQGKLPVNAEVGAYYDVGRPDNAAETDHEQHGPPRDQA
jgi:hypothetical protein